MRKTVFYPLFIWVFCFIFINNLYSQTVPSKVNRPMPAKITDAGRLYSTFSLKTKTQYYSEIKSQTGEAVFKDILLYCEEGSWPSEIATLSGRSANRPKMANYKTNLIAIFGGDYAILEIPEKGNQSMPSGMQPKGHSIYFIIGKDGIALTGSGDNESTAFPKAKITDSGQLYSTYDIKNETSWHAAIKKAVGEKGFQDVLKYANENNWPEGISNLEQWGKNKYNMTKYNVYLLVDGLDGKVILYCPADENKHMPSDLIPSRDIYFVMGESGISRDPNATPYEENVEEQEDSEGGVYNASIIDPMELYSTYDIQGDESAMKLYKKIFGDEHIDKAIEISHENGWPSGINSYGAREKVRSKFKDYNVRYIGEFGEEGEPVALLYVAPDDNSHMPQNMQPLDEDGLILLFKKSAIKVEGLVDPSDTYDVSEEDNDGASFETQLNSLINGLKDNFATLKGNEIKKENDAFDFLSKEYESKIMLKGAEKTVIRSSMGSFSVQAFYGEFRSKEDADAVYSLLVEQVEDSKLTCCTLVQDEQVLDNLVSTSWIPFDLNGKMDAKLKDMVLEVRSIKLVGIDKEFKSYDYYSVSLSAYHQK